MAKRIELFDTWRAGYGNAIVEVRQPGLTAKANIYYDEALTLPATNPQTLLSRVVAGVEYGKFARPLYINQSYQLRINSVDETGVYGLALDDLGNEDASDTRVTPTGGSVASDLADILGRSVNALDYGVLLPTSNPSASSSTNNATLTAAIGAVAADGGGYVEIPEGIYAFTQLSLPSGVVLRGAGRTVTTLQSVVGDRVVTLAGDRAGFSRLTLDGVSKQSGSIGVYAKARVETVIDDIGVKRFATGGKLYGIRRPRWAGLYIDNCTTGWQCRGDNDGVTTDDNQFRNTLLVGGMVENCSSVGIELHYEDKKVYHNAVVGVGFQNNTGTAAKITGARYTRMAGCWWEDNTTNLAVADGADTTRTQENTVVGLEITGGHMLGGAVTLTGTCQNVVLDGMELGESVAFTLTTVKNPVLLRGCQEDSTVTIGGGDSIKVVRVDPNAGNPPGAFVMTTDATPTEAYSVDILPGQVGVARAVVVAVQRNGTGYAVYHINQGFRRPGSTLAYQTQTANFTAGDTITGQTSGATARIIADSDSGSTGTLTLKDIVGAFQNNEIITGASGGSATVNGTLTASNVALLGSITNLQAVVESDAAWACVFAVNVGELQVQVTGEAAKTIEWTPAVELTVG